MTNSDANDFYLSPEQLLRLLDMLEYSNELESMSDNELADEILERIYPELKFDYREAIISEVITRLKQS